MQRCLRGGHALQRGVREAAPRVQDFISGSCIFHEFGIASGQFLGGLALVRDELSGTENRVENESEKRDRRGAGPKVGDRPLSKCALFDRVCLFVKLNMFLECLRMLQNASEGVGVMRMFENDSDVSAWNHLMHLEAFWCILKHSDAI